MKTRDGRRNHLEVGLVGRTRGKPMEKLGLGSKLHLLILVQFLGGNLSRGTAKGYAPYSNRRMEGPQGREMKSIKVRDVEICGGVSTGA